jgi:hypothetical protein
LPVRVSLTVVGASVILAGAIVLVGAMSDSRRCEYLVGAACLKNLQPRTTIRWSCGRRTSVAYSLVLLPAAAWSQVDFGKQLGDYSLPIT